MQQNKSLLLDLNLYYDPLNTGLVQTTRLVCSSSQVISRTRLALELCVWQKGSDQLLYRTPLAPKMNLGRESREATWKVEGLRADLGSALLHYIQSLQRRVAGISASRQPISSNGIERIWMPDLELGVHCGRRVPGCIDGGCAGMTHRQLGCHRKQRGERQKKELAQQQVERGVNKRTGRTTS